MWDDVAEYVRTCLTCQQDKSDKQKTPGLLELLPIRMQLWEIVSLDFINNLPKVRDLKNILVIVDRFLKYAMFVPVTKHCLAKETAHLLFKFVVKY